MEFEAAHDSDSLETREHSRRGAVSVNNCGQSYKQFTLIIYESRVVIWGIFKSVMSLEP